MEPFIIEKADVVLPREVLKSTPLLVEDGLIGRIGGVSSSGVKKRIQADGCLLLPGIIDLHSDALEKDLEPRPNTFFPVDLVVLEMDKKLAACGICTIFHSVSFAEGEIGIRSNAVADQIIREINRLRHRLGVRTRIHARYELTDEGALPFLHRLIDEGKIHLLSLMNHYPGQGQFQDLDAYEKYYRAVYQKSPDEIKNILQRKTVANRNLQERAAAVIEWTRPHRIPLASHDDDSKEKIAWLKGMGVTISDFPVNLEAALTAADLDIHVCLGAPNALRGRSQGNNLSAREAIRQRACHILCSDYAPMTMLHAVFTLTQLKVLSLLEAIRLVTLNPARAVGIDQWTGSLEEGKAADFLIVDTSKGRPQILKTFVGGREVFSTCSK
jgi:alpha-D-ribose 1-methylphosphonate 5-triphosphate diphosphatase